MTCDEGKWRLLNPLSIRFSQPRIAPHFRAGYLLQDTVLQVIEAPLDELLTEPPSSDAAEGVPPYDVVLVPPFPAIRVISWLPKLRDQEGKACPDGERKFGDRAWFALDNRRLQTLQHAAAKRWPRQCCVVVRCIEEVPGSTIKELRKFRTTTEGRSIEVGVRAGDTLPWNWRQAVPAGVNDADVEPEGFFSEDLFDAFQWAPQALAASEGASESEELSSTCQGKDRQKLAPCPASGWQYVDPSGKIQGPFELEKMRIWHQHNFFYADLPMRSDPVDAFLPFSKLFPAGEQPFVGRVIRCRQ